MRRRTALGSGLASLAGDLNLDSVEPGGGHRGEQHRDSRTDQGDGTDSVTGSFHQLWSVRAVNRAPPLAL